MQHRKSSANQQKRVMNEEMKNTNKRKGKGQANITLIITDKNIPIKKPKF